MEAIILIIVVVIVIAGICFWLYRISEVPDIKWIEPEDYKAHEQYEPPANCGLGKCITKGMCYKQNTCLYNKGVKNGCKNTNGCPTPYRCERSGKQCEATKD